jgi:hypothetical protein
MNNLVIGSLAITLGGTSVLAGASPPMEQSPGVPTPPAWWSQGEAEADNGADPNSSARVTEQKSVGGVPVLISRPGVVNPNTRLVCFIMASVPRKTHGRSQRCCDLKKWMRSSHL